MPTNLEKKDSTQTFLLKLVKLLKAPFLWNTLSRLQKYRANMTIIHYPWLCHIKDNVALEVIVINRNVSM